MSYASLSELKLALRIDDTNDDTLLTLALNAADSLIDAHCDRTFVAEVSASARSFTPSGGRVDVDDFYTTDGLIVAVGGNLIPAYVENVSAGYRVGPDNAPEYGEPYTFIEYDYGAALTWGWWVWSRHNRVSVTAKWGYAENVPQAVKQAALLQASRLFSRRNSPYGIAGSPDMGSELRLLAKVDPDVAVMLGKFVRMDVQ